MSTNDKGDKKKRSGGVKFTEKYGVEATQIYKGNTKAIKIPPRGHALYDETAPTTYDELRVQEIDQSGAMTTPIELWTDPDAGIAWIIDGRGRQLDVDEVNRRRAKDGRDPVQPYYVPFNGDEKAAVARVRIKNYHRRTPTPSGMAVDLHRLRQAGYSWEDCAKILHFESADPEQWGRKLIPLAHCIPEVREAIDKGLLPKTEARAFGGGKPDGSERLGNREQADLLKEKLAAKNGSSGARKVFIPSPGVCKRAVEALTNTAVERAFAAGVAWSKLGSGEAMKAFLKDHPELVSILKSAIDPPAPTKKKAVEKTDAAA